MVVTSVVSDISFKKIGPCANDRLKKRRFWWKATFLRTAEREKKDKLRQRTKKDIETNTRRNMRNISDDVSASRTKKDDLCTKLLNNLLVFIGHVICSTNLL